MGESFSQNPGNDECEKCLLRPETDVTNSGDIVLVRIAIVS